ncbi:MAG: IPT/TIG domain-containing protein, partial [Planctomycetota bacterium]
MSVDGVPTRIGPFWGFVYVPAGPSVVSVAPTAGPCAGATPVTLTGSGFADGARVLFAGDEATNVVVGGGGTTITCLTPEHLKQEIVDVRVINPDGSAGELASAFSYLGSPDADLADLLISAGTLSPAFSPATVFYSVQVPSAQASVTVTPTASGAGATIEVNGT